MGRPYAYVGANDGVVRVFVLDMGTGALSPVQEVEAGEDPSFLAFAPDGRTLYAADEGSGELACFSIDPSTGRLAALNRVPSNGSQPTHIAVDRTGKLVFAVNYGSGDVTVVATEPDGRLGIPAVAAITGAQPHQIVLDPSGRFAFVLDKGDDTLSQLVLDPTTGALAENAIPSIPLPRGSGPRHMAFHPAAPYAYVIRENDDRITMFPYDAAKGMLDLPIQTIGTLPDWFDQEQNTAAEIAFGPSGKYLYASNRGHDSIAIFSCDAATGLLAVVGHEPSGGRTPRHFSIEASGEILLAANLGSNDVVTFRVDATTGTLERLRTTPLPGGPSFVGVLYL